MPFRAETPFLPGCQDFEEGDLIAVSMPFRAETPFLPEEHGIIANIGKKVKVSMPFRAETPFLRYPFKNLGFMRFLEPVFAGIYQNILTMTIFRAC